MIHTSPQLNKMIEALVFAEAKPISWQRLTTVTGASLETITQVVNDLRDYYNKEQRGIRLVVTDSKVQMVTAPELHEVITALVKDERTGELSKPSLETLAIIAYRSPVTKAELEMIRGVNCSLIIRNLLIRGLVEERLDSTKGVEVYDITPQYLQLLGLSSVQQLPNYEHLHRDLKIGEVLQEMESSDDFFKH